MLAGWVLAVVASVVLIASFLGEALTSTAEVTTQTDSKRADQLLAKRMGRGLGAQRGGGGPLPDADRRGSPGLPGPGPAARQQAVRAHRVLDAAAEPGWGSYRSPRTAMPCCSPLPLRGDAIEPVVELVEVADGQGGLGRGTHRRATADRDFQELADQDLRDGELAFGLPAALVVLLLVFGLLARGAGPPTWQSCRSWSRSRWRRWPAKGVLAVGVRGQHDHRDGPGPGHRLLAVCPVAVPRGTRPRPPEARRHRDGWRDRQPGGAAQRPGLRLGHDRHGAGPRHHPAQPGGGRSWSGWSRWRR